MKILIKKYREQRGWSQYRLAKESGLQPSTISQIESGSRQYPSILSISKIADALDITVDALLDRAENPIPTWEIRGQEIPNLLKGRPFKIRFY